VSTPDLVSDLIYLRKDRGLTVERLANTTEVLPATREPAGAYEAARARVVAALRSMQDSQGGRALWAAYGIDEGSAPTLKERRAAYAKQVGRSADTLRGWEDSAIEELALRLLSGWFAGAATPGELTIPHGGYLISRLHIRYVIRDRIFFESQQTRTVISLVDGAQTFVYGTYSPTELSDVTGGSAEVLKRTQHGVLHQITFDRPLRRGEQHTFSFREREPERDVPVEPPEQDFAGQTFESPTLRYRCEVAFLGDRPSDVWVYDKLSRIERPGEATSANALQVDTRGQVCVELSDLYGGLCSGVAWAW
jgi:hypothetical protein